MELILERLDALDAHVHIMRNSKSEGYRKDEWACQIKGTRDNLKVETGFMRGASASEALSRAWVVFEPASDMVAPLALPVPRKAEDPFEDTDFSEVF